MNQAVGEEVVAHTHCRCRQTIDLTYGLKNQKMTADHYCNNSVLLISVSRAVVDQCSYSALVI